MKEIDGFKIGDKIKYKDKRSTIERWGTINSFLQHKSGRWQAFIDYQGKKTKGSVIVKRIKQIWHYE